MEMEFGVEVDKLYSVILLPKFYLTVNCNRIAHDIPDLSIP